MSTVFFPSVEQHRVEQRPVALGLVLLHKLVDLVVEVVAGLKELGQLAKLEGAKGRVFKVILLKRMVGFYSIVVTFEVSMNFLKKVLSKNIVGNKKLVENAKSLV